VLSVRQRWVDKKIHKSSKRKSTPQRKYNTPNPSALYPWNVAGAQGDNIERTSNSATENATIAEASVKEVAELEQARDDDPDCVACCNELSQAPQAYSDVCGRVGEGMMSLVGRIGGGIVGNNTWG